MKRKIIVFILSFSLMLVGLTSVVGEVGNERRGFKVTESEGSSNFEVVINTPEDGEVFQHDEKVTVEYVVENTGDVEDTQEIVSTVNGEKINVTEMTIGPEMSRIGHTEFNASYWSEQFEITEVRLDLIDSPDIVELGDYFEATGQGHYAYLFPETDEVALKEDHLEDYRFTIRNESDILVEVPAEDIELTPKENYSTFEGSVPTEGLEEGNYTLQLEALEKNMQYYESISKNLTLVESTSDHEERIISEGIDFLKTEKNSSREECKIGLEYMEEEKALEIKVSSEDDEDSVSVIIEETEAEEIHNWHDLDAVRDDLDGNYILMDDLDENTDGYDELVDTENGWNPIGDFNNRFIGTFDGNEHEISDLYIDRSDTDYVGLFGAIDNGAEITDVGLVDVNVSGNIDVGALVGENLGTIFGSYATGTVSGDGKVGALVGMNYGGRVNTSYAMGTVSGSSNVGGLTGWNGGTVEHSYTTGDVSGTGHVGGLVGDNVDGTVFHSHAMGDVTGNEKIGGLVGRNDDTSTVSNSYTASAVSGASGETGGFVGENLGTVENSYSTAIVSGHQDVGGFVGENLGTVENSYWNIETSGQDESDGGEGRTTNEMTWEYTENTYEGWDFNEIWMDGDHELVKDDEGNTGYPALQWQEVDRFEFEIIGDQTAGESFEIEITAYDQNDNLAAGYTRTADLTDTTGTIDPVETGEFTEGAWIGQVSITGADTNVVITAEDDDISGESEEFEVKPAEADYIEILPEESTITAGETEKYTAIAYDEYENEIGDVSADTTWSIEDGAGGSWMENEYTTEVAGEYWIVEADYEGLTDTALLTVEPGAVDTVELDPSEDQTIVSGEKIEFSAVAYDEYDNLITDDETEFGWQSTDEYGLFDETEAGDYQVTATYDNVASEPTTVTVIVEDDDDIPGFTSTLLLLAGLIAVAIYHKKDQ